jgi:hypothetical protein
MPFAFFRTLLACAPALPAASAFAQATEGLKLDVPFGPTSFATIDTMLRVAGVTSRDFLIDLGSGDGRINIVAARDYGARGEGYDLDPKLVQISNEFARIAKVSDKVKFLQENLFDADLARASVVAIYLGPQVTPRTRPKLLAELKPGARIVSHNFMLGEWRPDLTIITRDYGSTVFFWWVPARIAGVWRGIVDIPGVGPRPYSLDLRQTYQEIEGEAASSGLEIALRDGRLAGTGFSFLLQERNRAGEFTFRRFLGEVRGETIVGHFRSENPPAEIPVTLTRTVRAEPGPAGAWSYRR